MRSIAVTAFTVLALVGCGGKKGSGTGTSGTLVTVSVPVVTVTSASPTTVSQTGVYDLNDSGSGVVTVAPNQTIRELIASGSAVIYIGPSSTISGSVTLSGSAILHVPAGYVFTGLVAKLGTSSIVYDSPLPHLAPG